MMVDPGFRPKPEVESPQQFYRGGKRPRYARRIVGTLAFFGALTGIAVALSAVLDTMLRHGSSDERAFLWVFWIALVLVVPVVRCLIEDVNA